MVTNLFSNTSWQMDNSIAVFFPHDGTSRAKQKRVKSSVIIIQYRIHAMQYNAMKSHKPKIIYHHDKTKAITELHFIIVKFIFPSLKNIIMN